MIVRALFVFSLVAAAGITVFAADPAGSAAPRLSAGGHYAFPVAAEIQHMTWTRQHWDGSNAVDLFAAPELPMESQEFKRFSRAPVVAVTSGTVRRADNERGGIALVLEGDDGLQYYYAHLREAAIKPGAEPRTVETGEQIGMIGKTGRWTRWIEPHLHFAVSTPEAESHGWQPDINAAEWIHSRFNLKWEEERISPYPPARPQQSPLAVEAEVVRDFEAMRARHPDLASIEIKPAGRGAASHSSGRYPVYSPLHGEVRVHRNAELGLRVQITNRHYEETVVLSGLSELIVGAADTVGPGEPVGHAPVGETVNVMYFRDGQLTDPEPLLELRAGSLP